MKKIVWLHTDYTVNDYRREHDLYGGIGYYRVIKPAEVLKKWFDIEVVGADFEKWGVGGDTTQATKYQRFEQYDLVISRQFRTGLDASNTLATGKHFKKKVLLDIDDNLFGLRKDNPAYKDYEYGQGFREYMQASMALSDGLMVSTEPLKKLYKGLNKKIDVLPNCNDINDWPKESKVWDDGKVRIGFAGGQGHLADLDLILEPMAYILAKYPNVLFEIVGAITPQDAMRLTVQMNEFCKKNIADQVRIAGGTLAWQGYPEMLASFGWDIVIAPLIDDDFNRSKSHIRWMEASMIHCPVVASPVYPYIKPIQGANTIQDEKTGLFAKNREEWFEMLDGLISTPEARKELANNAYTYIKDYWQYEQHAYKWKKVIEKYL
jgi:glycosyltransferase involved in cell wall biosynthesis